MRPRKSIQFVLGILCVLFVFVGCGEKNPAGTEIVLPTMESIQANEVIKPVEGGSLVLAIPSQINTLDPYLCDVKEIQNILSLIYEPLIQYDATGRLSAVLAEKWEKVDEAGKAWRITLRSNAVWQGIGTEFTADDVVFSYNLLKTDEYANSYYRPLLNQIDSIIVEDAKTIQVVGREEGMLVLNSMIFPIVSREHYERGTQPTGTGPYRLTAANPTLGLQLTNNPSWWKNKPYISQIQALPMEQAEIPLGALEMGTLNYVVSNVLTSSRYRDPGKVGMTEVLSQQSEMLLINHRNVLLKNAEIRKAIAYAIDPRDIILKVYLNHAVATDVPIAPDSWLYDPLSKQYDINPEKSKQFLTDDGWQDIDGDGILDKRDGDSIQSLRFRLLVNDTPDNQLRKDMAVLLKAQLAEIGIGIEIIEMPFTDSDQSYATALHDGGFDLALVGFNVDADGDLRPFIGSTGNRNYGSYSDETMDTLLSQFIAARDEKEAKVAIDAIQKEFTEQLPMIHLLFRTTTIGYSELIQFPDNLQVRDNSTFLGIEKWYFNDEGRVMYAPKEVMYETTWAGFDRAPVIAATQSGDDVTEEAIWGIQSRTPNARVAGAESGSAAQFVVDDSDIEAVE